MPARTNFISQLRGDCPTTSCSFCRLTSAMLPLRGCRLSAGSDYEQQDRPFSTSSPPASSAGVNVVRKRALQHQPVAGASFVTLLQLPAAGPAFHAMETMLRQQQQSMRRQIDSQALGAASGQAHRLSAPAGPARGGARQAPPPSMPVPVLLA